MSSLFIKLIYYSLSYYAKLRVQYITYNFINKYSMGFNLLHTLEPLSRIVPDIAIPSAKPTIQVKTAYTAITLFIYLICSQVPLFGVERSNFSSDPFYWTRVILASNRGTLMQLGIGPIISASWFLQIISAIGFLKIQGDKDSAIYEGLQRTLALVLCFGQAAGQIWYGAYGSPSQIGISGILFIIGQLMLSGLIVILLDEMLKKGYGLGSGLSLFLVANTSQRIFWSLFSPVTLSSQFGIEFQGSFISLIHFLSTKPSKWGAIYQAFTRTPSPNLSSFVGTIIIFFIVIYLQGFQVKIPFIHQQYRGYKTHVPVKLFYTSTIGVILQSMVVSNFYLLSKILYQRFNKTILINLLGKWEGNQIIGGLVWYISPPLDFNDFCAYPHRFVTYLIFVCASCAFFSRCWIEITKQTPRHIALKMRQQGFTLPSYKSESAYSVLNKYIPTAAMLGGITIGLLTILGDALNATGSSTGILLSVSILYKFYEKLKG